ncbi:LysR family transcriptional regulator [Pseudomonas sp. Fig-3]|uniref:LysR family transcriptional regulator n=1 Tax=unclassified Pseudomonas TaxID=196821 RepID=UPI0010D8874B|nr:MULTISPECIES: LysR family transcriptional regulator [unclassified Pseudomonas]MDR8386132.1 LysR substrate-binding domain-containing protein [Pseudomonas sp. JL2]TNB84022.1 LysR family transcriptional regulator [Pseudomonas sp. Fig-3]WLG21331.1 LysR substrate-binding domain-containing protein [Pseudomonas sp. FP1154]VII90828.1 Transcriptional regulator, LysR family [Pseudomonas sp. FG-3G]
MPQDRLGLSELDAVIAVARRGSFRQAAIDLDVSTTALSNTIAQLETRLESRLFNRTTRSVAITEAGKIFLEQVGPALQDLRAALDAVRSHNAGPSGTLRINAFASAARSALLPLVMEFLQHHPQVHIDLVTEGRLVDIVADGFDFGVRSASLVPNDVIVVPLGPPQRYAVVGSPAYFEKHGKPRTPSELLQHRCIRVRLPNGAIFPWHFERDGEVTRLDVNGPLTLDESSVVKVAVQEGMGLGFFMEQDVHNEIRTGQFVRTLEDWTPPRDKLCLYYPNRRNPSAAAKAFIDLARASQAKLDGLA